MTRTRKQPPAEENAPIKAKGAKVTITHGEELFAPIQYNSFRVGPTTVEIDLELEAGKAEGIDEVISTVRKALAKEHQKEFERQLEAYMARLKQAGEATRRHRGR